MFAAGGAIATGLGMLATISRRNFFIAAGFTVFIYSIYALLDPVLVFEPLETSLILGGFLLTVAAVWASLHFQRSFSTRIVGSVLLVWLIVYANFYQHDKILEMGNVNQVNKELITGEEFDDPEIRNLLEGIHARESDGMYRIEWMQGVRNNTPIVQDFQGLSAYSSILNKNLLYFYLYDLEIDMMRESVSRYATLGNRANLFSLARGKYIIRPLDDANIPYGFTEILSSEKYKVYENDHVLPFARSATEVYSEDKLSMHPPLVREHAMLNGIVLETEDEGSPIQVTGDITSQFSIEEVQADFENGILEVTGERGGIDLVRNEPEDVEDDLYISFRLVNTAEDQGFNLEVNDYVTSRKSNASVYKTFVDDMTLRIPSQDTISIRLPEGRYILTELQVFEEDYEILDRVAAQPSRVTDLKIDGSKVELVYDNSAGDEYLSAVIPYEIGWSAAVNGEKTEVLKADYAFVGVPLEEGENRIEFSYTPPFFVPSLILSVLALFIGVFWIFRRKRTPDNRV